MVALIAAADPDGPDSVTPTAVLETRFDTPGLGPVRRDPFRQRREHLAVAVDHGQRRAVRSAAGGRRAHASSIRRSSASTSVWRSPAAASSGTTCTASRRASRSASRRACDTYDAQLASFRQQMVGWFVSLAVLLIATLALLLRWLLRPVRRLEREIKQVEAGERDQLGDAWPRELAAVTSNLNALLEARAHAHQALSRHAGQSRAQPQDAVGRDAPVAGTGRSPRPSGRH